MPTSPDLPLTPDELERLAASLSESLSDGSASSAELDLVTPAEHADAVQVLRAAWEADTPRGPTTSTEAFVARMMADVRRPVVASMSPSVPSSPALPPATRARRWSPMQLASAALGVCFVTGALVFGVRRGGSGDAIGQIVRTASGERTTITLADGSRVTLAPHSTLTIARAFGADTRTVSLTGEAYFDVVSPSASQAAPPFVVRTNGVTTRVLGTQFMVRLYPTDSAVRVAVLSGKVSAGGAGASVVLAAGAVGYATDSTAFVSADSASVYARWVDGHLEFRNAPVADVLATLSRWYGYDFKLVDSVLATRHVTASFDLSAGDETMVALQRLLNVTARIDGKTVTLRPRPARTPLTTPPTRAPGRPGVPAEGGASSPTEVGR